ncbi:MAG: tripartite tricarboxylate transporter substrate binding protein [Hyphomicrobium sp.]
MTALRALISFCVMAPLIWALNSSAGVAQARYPERPIRVIIPFPPGGVYDSVGRPLAERLRLHLGQVVIENLAGAGGTRGAAMAVRAQPDGYTLFLGGTGALVITPLASRRPLYDPLIDFEPISRLAVVGLSISVHPSIPARDLKAMLSYTRANSGQLTFGSSGTGTLNHLTVELFKKLAGTPSVPHVPHSGAGALLNDVVGGHIPLAVVNVTGNVLALHREGKIRLLAVTNAERLDGAPDIPTTAEAGFPELDALVFAGLFAPKGTPRAIIDQIAEATKKALADHDLQAIYLASGFITDRNSNPEKMGEFLRAELKKWKPLLEEIGFKLE